MRSFLLLAALGDDRPGLAAAVARYVAERGGNVDDSRAVALGGVFGLMLLVSADADGARRIRDDAAALERATGLRVVARTASDPRARGAHTAGATLLGVTVRAFDREGIVMEVSDVMRSTGGNIVQLDTTTYDEPTSGAPLFQMEMTVAVREAADVERITRELRALAERERLTVDVQLPAPEPGAALSA
jgi:glycine cleavage system transcriptional repressor